MRRLFIAFGALILLSGCSSTNDDVSPTVSPSSTSDATPFPEGLTLMTGRLVPDRGWDEEIVELEGDVTSVDGCMVLRSDEGDAPLIWPRGTVMEDPDLIVGLAGTVRFGRPIQESELSAENPLYAQGFYRSSELVPADSIDENYDSCGGRDWEQFVHVTNLDYDE